MYVRPAEDFAVDSFYESETGAHQREASLSSLVAARAMGARQSFPSSSTEQGSTKPLRASGTSRIDQVCVNALFL